MSQFVGFGEGCDVRAGGVWCLQQSASFLPFFLSFPPPPPDGCTVVYRSWCSQHSCVHRSIE